MQPTTKHTFKRQARSGQSVSFVLSAGWDSSEVHLQMLSAKVFLPFHQVHTESSLFLEEADA